MLNPHCTGMVKNSLYLGDRTRGISETQTGNEMIANFSKNQSVELGRKVFSRIKEGVPCD
jgi:hypothetical protein